MQTKIKNWGNSLALRIPRDYAQNLHLTDGTSVELRLTPEGLLLIPSPKKPSLDELLTGVTPELVGGEEDWGPAQGREEW